MNRVWIALAALIALAACTQPFERGRKLENKGELAGAFAAFTAACDGGDRRGCHERARLMEHGWGTPADPVAAAAIHREMCDEGLMQSCTSLGEMNRRGSGMPQDFAKAKSLFDASCAKGDDRACVGAAAVLVQTHGDMSEAKRLLEESCDRGEPLACGDLGSILVTSTSNVVAVRGLSLLETGCRDGARGGSADACGILAERIAVADPGRARRIALASCEHHSGIGCVNAGLMLSQAVGGAADPVRAAELYGRACDDDVPLGCRNLGKLLHEGRGVRQDVARARKLWADACDEERRACVDLANSLLDDPMPDGAKAAEFLRRACEGGEPMGCANLAATLIDGGPGVPADPVEAAKLATSACAAGNAFGCANLGRLHEVGSGGMKKDAAEAARLYGLACRGGVPAACAAIGAR